MQGGRRVRHPLLNLGVRPNQLPHNRFGFAIGKRVGTAVVRNRIRRRLRAILRDSALAPGHDIVITAAPQSATAPFQDLRAALHQCVRRANLAQNLAETAQN